MSYIVIVGASTGIGRDIVFPLAGLGHTALQLKRDADVWNKPMRHVDALLLCQRYRGPDEWSGELEVSLSKTKRIMDWAVRYMKKGGSIVVMASVAAVSVEEEQPVSYHACKAALVEMVKYYAVVLGKKRINVNAIIPGLTIKPEAREFYNRHPALEETYKDITPLGRMGTVDDLADLVSFLVGSRSTYLTGQTIVLDGGISLRSPWALARRVHPKLRRLRVTQRKAAK